MANENKPEPPEFLRSMTTKEIALLVHGVYPEDDPGMNRARCDVLMEALGRELPEDWTFLMTDGKLTDADFPAWCNIPNVPPGVRLFEFFANV